MTFSSQVILAIFFLYVVIASEQLFSILSCGLQKLIINSRFMKHMFIVLNIFLFTFILGWYMEQSINVPKQEYKKKENFSNPNDEFSLYELYKEEINILGRYFLYTFLIYVIFIMTTKCEIKYLSIFFYLLIVLFILFLVRSYSKTEGYSTSKKISMIDFLNKKEINNRITDFNKYLDTLDISQIDRKKEMKKFKINIILQNIEFIVFIIALIVLAIGFSLYFRRQYKDHKLHWNTLIFFFGKETCANILTKNNKNRNINRNNY